MGSGDADDRRPSLSRDVTRGAEQNHRLGGRENRAGLESAQNQGSPGLELTRLCKSPVTT